MKKRKQFVRIEGGKMAKPEKLPLLNDYIFKRTFTKEGTTGILKDLLEAILEVKITNCVKTSQLKYKKQKIIEH